MEKCIRLSQMPREHESQYSAWWNQRMGVDSNKVREMFHTATHLNELF